MLYVSYTYLHTYKLKLSSVTQYEVDNLHSLVTNKEVDFIILKNWKRISPGLDDFTAEFNQMHEESTPILHNLFQKIEDKGTFSSSFYDAGINLIPN